MTPRQANPDQKTRQILDAATAVLTQQGYAATTITQIAKEAGVSRGLLHYYFASKEDILVHIVRDSATKTATLVSAVFAQAESADSLVRALLMSLRHLDTLAPELFNLFFECWAVARQSPAVADELRVVFDQFRAAFQDGLATAQTRGIIAPTLPLNGLAALLTGLFDGLALQLLTDPTLADDPALWETAETTIRHALHIKT